MKDGIIILAAVVVIVCGGIWLTKNVTCFNFFGITRGCVVSN